LPAVDHDEVEIKAEDKEDMEAKAGKQGTAFLDATPKSELKEEKQVAEKKDESEQKLDSLDAAAQKLAAKAETLQDAADKVGASDEAKKAAGQAQKAYEAADEALQAMEDKKEIEDDEVEIEAEDKEDTGAALPAVDPPKFAVAERSAREACPYWNAIGVLDDHLELMCEGGQEFEFAFKPDGVESLAMACCPTPYKACALSERVAGCDALIAPLFMVDIHSATAEQALMMVQKVRGVLRDADKKCHVLPAEEPHVKCGGSPTVAAFDRPDIFCEMMLWQSEQLGDGGENEYNRNGCPWGGVAHGKHERHGKTLKQESLPSSIKMANKIL